MLNRFHLLKVLASVTLLSALLLFCWSITATTDRSPSTTSEMVSRQVLQQDAPHYEVVRSVSTVDATTTRATTTSTTPPVTEETVGLNTERRLQVKEMIKHAWDGYYKYSMGHNELRPISKTVAGSIFSHAPIGATLVDSLDTLYIVGLMNEFEEAKKWVVENFDMNKVPDGKFLSFFEVNIRFIGGFISAYLLSGDTVFKDKAIEVADKFSSAFKFRDLPAASVNVRSGQSSNWGWVPRRCSILSEIGSLHLEYYYLSYLTKNNSSYVNKVLNIRKILHDASQTREGVYYTLIDPVSHRWCNKRISLGANGDSFYEYLLKTWLVSDKKDTEARDMFYEAIDVLEKKLFHFKSKQNFLLISDVENNHREQSMQHLACFAGGMFALASIHATNEKSQHYMDIAKNITRTCHESYIKTATKLGADTFVIDEPGHVYNSNKEYILRPETVESYFYLWRLTHDPMYREWGWELVQALEAHCRISSGGYSGIKDVNRPGSYSDKQQSFFLAETLKYLYLLFSDDLTISLDEWVFNTEGHPFNIVHES